MKEKRFVKLNARHQETQHLQTSWQTKKHHNTLQNFQLTPVNEEVKLSQVYF